MDLTMYVGKIVVIDLVNGFYYEGKVLSTDENSLEIIDKKGHLVSIKEKIIVSIREIN